MCKRHEPVVRQRACQRTSGSGMQRVGVSLSRVGMVRADKLAIVSQQYGHAFHGRPRREVRLGDNTCIHPLTHKGPGLNGLIRRRGIETGE